MTASSQGRKTTVSEAPVHFGDFLTAFFADTAKQVKQGAPRFEARNFLLDEGIPEARAASYNEHFREPLSSTAEWIGGHEEYLDRQVFLEQPSNGIPKNLDPDRPDRCPETFRHEENFRAFGSAFKSLKLVRVVDVASIGREAGRSVEDLEARQMGSLDDEALQRFKASLHSWNQTCDLRPTYCGFLADLTSEDGRLFGPSPEEDAEGWANQLRDRLGLAHFDPGVRRGLPIFVFAYSVSSVPTRQGWRKGRPLAVPTVLDGRLSPAFCPAPRDEVCGRVVDLTAITEAPIREVLHPFRPLEANDLFRVGEVTRPVPADLWPARQEHLRRLRHLTGRNDYAALTDPELDEVTP